MTEQLQPAAAAGPGPWLQTGLGVAAGTALQLQQAALWPLAAYAALLLAGLLLLGPAWRGPARRRRPWLALLAAAAAAFALVGLRAQAFVAQALDPALEGQDLLLQVRVTAMPQPGDQALRLLLAVEGAARAGQPVRVPPRIELSWYHGGRDGGGAPPPAILAGDRWQLQARLRAPHGARNPHGFDYELWQWERGVQATGYVRLGSREPPPVLLSRGWRHPVERARQAVRAAIFARIAEPARAGVVAALAMGDQAAIERGDWELFRSTGVAHLLAVSGLHVTMFAWLATALVGWGWRQLGRVGWPASLWWPAPQAALVGGVLLALAYALFSGWGVPAQRTVLMLATVAWLRLSGRRWAWPLVLVAAGTLVLLLDPWALLQAGFWLSFVAVGVLFASDPGRPAQAPAPPALRLGRALARLLREQAVVSIALAPLTLLLFQQVSLVGLLANLLAIPWVTLVLTPLALLGVLLAPLWELAGAAAGLLMAVLGALARWPLASIDMAAVPLPLGAGAVAGALLLVLRLPPLWRALGLPLLLPALLWQAPRPAAGQFELLAVDVGQGNAVLVRTAGHSLLYDTGPRYGADSDAGQRVLVPLLRALGERLDRVIVSHPDGDHSGGAAAVLALQPQAELLASLPTDPGLQALHPVLPCVAGQAWDWDGVRFELLHPPPGPWTEARPNARSCVLRVAGAGAAALLAGDIERAQEAWLLDGGAPLRADLLLVPHHGSRSSTSAALVQAVAPRLALVQAGYRNRFGHPAPEVVQRLRDAGAAVIDSASCGAAHWRSASPDALVCERARRLRYWHHRGPHGP